MRKLLITGATGNVGTAVLTALAKTNSSEVEVWAGVRNPATDALPVDFAKPLAFDFGNPATVAAAFDGIDTLFLLRPPALADVKKYFDPLIDRAKQAAIRHIVFLSVQGAEKSAFIPHHKIEKSLEASGMAYTFLRPGYFMQNLTTTLKKDLTEKKQIFLPAGHAGFNWTDVDDIGTFAAKVLLHPENYQNRAYEITGPETLTFGQVATLISTVSHTPVKYVSPSLLRFFLQKRREGVATGYILVMMLLHYLPRFTPAIPLSTDFERVTGSKPKTMLQFVTQAFSKGI